MTMSHQLLYKKFFNFTFSLPYLLRLGVDNVLSSHGAFFPFILLFFIVGVDKKGKDEAEEETNRLVDNNKKE